MDLAQLMAGRYWYNRRSRRQTCGSPAYPDVSYDLHPELTKHWRTCYKFLACKGNESSAATRHESNRKTQLGKSTPLANATMGSS